MENQDEPTFDTPLPGHKVEQVAAEKVINDFGLRFRKTDPSRVPSNIPTACLLEGRKIKDINQFPQLLKKRQIFFFLEAASLLNLTTPQEVLHYLDKRQPWEDYDICLFDGSLKWCVGITHNDDIVVSVTNGTWD